MKKYIFLITIALAAISACKGTWLMYDTSQKDHITFKEELQVHTASFAMIHEDEIQIKATLYLMGQLSDKDRRFALEAVPCVEGDSINIAGTKYQVVEARPNIDYTLGDMVFPAGETTATLNITLHRQPEMLGDKYVRVGLKLVENEDFTPVPPDSSKTREILSPYLYIYVTDGEPACPFWWRDGKNKPGWHYDLGNYYPAKFRKLLDFMHSTETSSPVFYEYCVEHYGYYLDAKPDKAKNNNMKVFWRQTYASAWAKYVFIPLYNYYKQYYAEHPDDPNIEPMGTELVNQKAQTGWADPLSGKYGFFN